MTARSFVLALCIALVLAGCSGPAGEPTTTPAGTTTTPAVTTASPGDATTPDPLDALRIDFRADGTFTVTATAVAPENDGVRVHYADGSAVTYEDVQSRGDLPAEALEGAARVEPVVGGSSLSFTTSGSDGGLYGWPAQPSALIYSVTAEDGRLVEWRYLDCGEETVGDVTIRVTDDGSISAGHSCFSR